MARSRVQAIRSNVSGARPANQEPGIVYSNWADRQIGVVDAGRQPMDMVAVRYFATTASYTPGQLVVQNGKVYRAVAVISPGAFDPTKWAEISVSSGSGIWVSDSPPAMAPVQGQLLWESDSGDLFVWYEDADSGQWVQINTTGDEGSAFMLSPKGYGAVGNGVADDNAAIHDTVAAAYASGQEIYWEPGVYLTTTTIPHFHEIRHRGPGVVKRGSDLFYPDPKTGQTNNLYCGPSGDDLNDGLSSSQPMREIKTALALLKTYGPALDGTWKINAAAGTYKGQCEPPRNMPVRDYIYLLGAGVSGHPNVPTTIIDQAADPAMTYGIFTEGASRLRVENVLVKDFTHASGRQGVYIRSNATLITRNVHTSGCDVGFAVLSHSRTQIVGGIVSGADRGIEELFGCISDYVSAGSAAQGIIIKNCNVGLKRKEASTGHVDYINFEDNLVHFEIHAACVANVGGTVFKRGGPAVLVVGNGEVHNINGAVFGTGADAPAVRFKKVGDGILLEQTGWATGGSTGVTVKTGFGRVGDIAHSFNTPVIVDGAVTTGPTDVGHLVDALQPGVYATEGANFRVRIWGFVNNTGATTGNVITVQLLGWTAMAELSIPAGTPTGTQFMMEWEVVCTQDGNFQRCFGRGNVGATALAPVVVAATANLTDAAHSVGFRVDLDNAADKLTITDRMVEG